MTRGNQRELARAKNLKKNAEQTKKKAEEGLTLDQRKQRDADRMREKQQLKGGGEASGGAGAGASAAAAEKKK